MGKLGKQPLNPGVTPMANLLKDDDLHPYRYHYTTFGLEVSPVGLPRQAGGKACPGLPAGLK